MIVDPIEPSKDEEFASLDPADAPQTQAEEQAPQTTVEEVLPEKYRGKSPQDIIKMHQEAEKLISRQANEVHEVRKLADELIKKQLAQQETPKPVEEAPEVDFFENPQAAVKRTLESSEEFKELKALKAQMKARETATKLAQEHPDAFEIGQSPDFMEWVKGSKVRLALYAQADGDYDFDAANELLLSYKAQKGLTAKKTNAVQSASQDKALKAAAVDTNGSTEVSSRKIYRRADIMRLMTYDPDRYQAMQPEIMAAYAEGRVK